LRAAISSLAFVALICSSAAGSELAIHYTAIKRMLAEQVFTQEGRKYVRGSRTAKCNYAYLENPEIRGENGSLNVRARFSGRSALDVFGKCIGLGDSFDVTITAVPYYQEGVIRLKDLRVESKGRDSYYIRRVRKALGETLRKEFQYDLREDVKKIFEEKRGNAPYRQELMKFQVSSIRVTPEALVLALEFTLAVK
jgi:hypothetical protein